MDKQLTEVIIKVFALALYFVALLGYSYYLYKRKAFQMNAEPLTHQPLFFAAINYPFLSFMTFGFIAWYGHKPQLNADGLNNFLAISKLPLGLLSLAVPFGVIVSNIHRTIQTDRQIKEAQKKNKIDSYYSHRKNTVELLQNLDFPVFTSLKESVKIKFRNSYSTYKMLYPYATAENDNFKPSSRIILNSYKYWFKISWYLKIVDKVDDYKRYMLFNKIELALLSISEQYGFEHIPNKDLWFTDFWSVNDTKLYRLISNFRNEDELREALLAHWNSMFLIMEAIDYQHSSKFSNRTMPIVLYFLHHDSILPDVSLRAEIEDSSPMIIKLTRD